MDVFNSRTEFADQGPKVDVVLPKCVEVDLIEVKFNMSTTMALQGNSQEGMRASLALVCLLELQTHKNDEDAQVLQSRLVENALLKVLSAPLRQASDLDALVVVIKCFVSSLPPMLFISGTANWPTTMPVQLSKMVKEPLVMLRTITDESLHARNTKPINNLIQTMESDKSNEVCKLFNSLSAGCKVLAHFKGKIVALAKMETATERIEDLLASDGSTMTTERQLEVIVLVDLDFAILLYESFDRAHLDACLTMTADVVVSCLVRIVAIYDGVLSGSVVVFDSIGSWLRFHPGNREGAMVAVATFRNLVF